MLYLNTKNWPKAEKWRKFVVVPQDATVFNSDCLVNHNPKSYMHGKTPLINALPSLIKVPKIPILITVPQNCSITDT